MDLTIEQILGLAPDQFTLRAGQGAADRQRWRSLHQEGATIWGTFPNGRNKTGETAVYLRNFSLSCTCSSRKFPCRHLLGILLLWYRQAKLFTPLPPPRALATWVERQKIRHNRPARPNDSISTPKHPHNLEMLKSGLSELELWLTDMVRQGLALLPERPKSYWEAMAHRLIDAHAPALAQELRDMAKVPAGLSNWPEEYLKRIGRLYLIVQGFRRFETLPAAAQSDLQTAVGWLPPPIESEITRLISDDWIVLGRHQRVSGSQMRQTTWLWGQESRSFVQSVSLLHSSNHKGRSLPTNSTWQGALCFSLSNWQQLAIVEDSLQQVPLECEPKRFYTIHEAVAAYSHALALNPWLHQFPMVLGNILPAQSETGWQLMDKHGACLPLPDKFTRGWHLLALAGNRQSLTLFGVWNGRTLEPLSARVNGRWQDIHIWRGVR